MKTKGFNLAPMTSVLELNLIIIKHLIVPITVDTASLLHNRLR